MVEQTKKISRERRKTLLRRLKQEVGPKKKSLYQAGVLSWLQFLMRLVSFYLIADGLARWHQGQPVSIAQLLVKVVCLSGIGYGASLWAKRYQGLASQYARNQLKKRFFEVFEREHGEFDASFSQADVMTVASQGIDSLDTYFQHYLTLSLRTYFNCTTVLLLVFLIYPVGGLIFLLCLPLIPISIILMQKRSKAIMAHYWATYMDVGNLFMDDLRGMNTLYAYGAAETYQQSFVERAEAFRRSTMDLLRFQLESVGYMDGVMYLGVGISGFFAVNSLAQGQLSLFHLIFFVLIAAEFFAPIREMGYGMHLVMMNTKMADRIYRFLDSSVPAATDQPLTGTFKAPVNEIRLMNLTFAYDDQVVLDQVTASVTAGKLFAVAGESGLGKTTLAKLFQKTLPVQEGQIFFEDLDLATLSRDEVYQQVLYVSPDSYLFNASIYDNLALATAKTKEEILSWLQDNGLLEFVSDLPDGLDTLVGENGNRLSPGQRQQVLCARALLSQRSIYIFDEMTSSLDSANEEVLFAAIKALSQRAIVLFISHKMKQVMQADRVLFMAKDEAVQIGTPDQLLETSASFAQLVKTQEELEAILHG